MSDSELPDPKKSLDLNRLLKQNPEVDPRQVAEVRTIVKARRQAGLPKKSYNIDSPYERRPLTRPEI
jgi:hypothetical protein